MENNGLSPDVENVRKRTRLTALTLGAAVLASLMFLMYAFVQKAEADKQRKIAEQEKYKASEYQKLVGDLDDRHEAVLVALRSEIDSLKRSCK